MPDDNYVYDRRGRGQETYVSPSVVSSRLLSKESPTERLQRLGRLMKDETASNAERREAAAKVKVMIVDEGLSPENSFALLAEAKHHRPELIPDPVLEEMALREKLRLAARHEWISHLDPMKR